MRTTTLFLIIAGLFFLMSCEKEKDLKQQDEKTITDYLQRESLTAQRTPSGLYYIIENPGVFPKPTINSKVTVHYKGYHTNKTVFETTHGKEPVTFPLNDVIEGWKEGLQLFGTGGKGTLLIPSHLGYGSTIMPGIPANSVLIFDVHLIKVE